MKELAESEALRGGNEWGLMLGRLPSSVFYTLPFCFVFAPSSTREPVYKPGSIISFGWF